MRAALESWERSERKRQSPGTLHRFPRCRATGIQPLDSALPGYGLPISGFTCLRGESWGDRVALTLAVLGRATDRGERTAYVDGRHALQPAVARALGVQTERLLLATPRDCLQGLKAAEVALGCGRFGVVALDLRLPLVSSRAASSGRIEGLLRRLQLAAERGRAVGIWLSEKPWPLPTALRLEVSAARAGVRVRRLGEGGTRSPAWKVALTPSPASCAREGD
jgi:hypothetical protein